MRMALNPPRSPEEAAYVAERIMDHLLEKLQEKNILSFDEIRDVFNRAKADLKIANDGVAKQAVDRIPD
jgi:hypothetical protein